MSARPDLPPVDLLALGAHPDDVELSCGGTLACFARRGHRTGILDLTRGELGSRGTAPTRDAEAEAAAAVLGVAARRNAGLPDGGLDPFDPDQRLAVVRVLRELRPRVLLLPWREVRHPDHAHASALGEEAAFRAGLHKVETGQEPFRPASILYYMERYAFEPTLILDVSADHGRKLEAIRAFRSQFERSDDDTEPATYLTRPGFLESIAARDRHYGELAGFTFGEPFRARGALALVDPAALLGGGTGRAPGEGGGER